jgi:hypothetical protein
VLVLACGSTTEGAGDRSAGAPADDGRRVLDASVIADGSSTVVSARVIGSRGLPTALRDGEALSAHVGEEDYVLTLATDENGDPFHRATLPALLQDTSIELRIVERGNVRPSPVVRMHVTEPFTIEKAPTELRVGEQLYVDFVYTPSMPSGRALVTFDGSCLPEMLPGELRTFGSFSEARFETTNLHVTGGGCDVVTTIMVVNETRISTSLFDSSLSPPAKGIQQRTFTMHVTP